LAHLLNHASAQEVATSLQEMTDIGTSSAGVAKTLDLLAAALAERPPLAELVDVVTTGPELSAAAKRDTGVVVSDLFRKAEQSVVVAGYAVYQRQKVFQALAGRMAERPELRVRLYFDISRKPGDTTIGDQLIKRFCRQFEETQWPAGSDRWRKRVCIFCKLHGGCAAEEHRDRFTAEIESRSGTDYGVPGFSGGSVAAGDGDLRTCPSRVAS
jgi:hypothetical protein